MLTSVRTDVSNQYAVFGLNGPFDKELHHVRKVAHWRHW